MRRVVLVTVLTLAVAGPFASSSTALAKIHPCTLLTKKQASAALGFEVVERVRSTEQSSGAEECEYRTEKYWNETFEDLEAPLKLQITTQPLKKKVAAVLDELEADAAAVPVEGLGDRAFYNSGNDLVVVVGKVVIQSEVTNIEWTDDELQTYVLGPELTAMQQVVAKLQKTR
ncbi:MAG TPA: hypothetical protein VFW06_03460 [Acidimicrobiia bacterium]|nr:hypothetical protein [Acidimicrobiia bacterium]